MRYCWFSADAFPLLHISQFGFADNPAITRWGPGTRSQYILHYVISGAGYFQGRRLQAGEGFLITPGMTEVYAPDPQDPWGFLWIISSDARMAPLLPCFCADEETSIFRYNFVPYMRRLAEQLQAEPSQALSGAAMLEQFMGILRRHEAASSAEAAAPAARRYVDFAVRYIEENYHQPLSITHLTKLLGVSQPYLCRIFLQAKGISPRQYLTQCRLAQARHLLTSTDLPIAQVAFSIGFEDALAFTRFFSAHERLSPSGYRREYSP